MKNVVIIPEAGGDLGSGALKMLSALGHTNILLLESDVDAVASLGYSFAFVPKIRSGKKEAISALIEVLGTVKGACILPTGEFFPELLFDEEVQEVVRNQNIQTFNPDMRGWGISRDKLLLGGFPWGVSTRSCWAPDHTFGKPRYGVGARGCGLVRTLDEAVRIEEETAEEYVYTENLPGNDWVVDLIVREKKALTRKVLRQRGGADTDFVFTSSPELEGIAFAVAEELRTPVANVQFRFDSQNRPHVIDVGTRLSGASCGARHIGINWVGGLLGVPGWWNPISDWKGKRIVRTWAEVLV